MWRRQSLRQRPVRRRPRRIGPKLATPPPRSARRTLMRYCTRPDAARLPRLARPPRKSSQLLVGCLQNPAYPAVHIQIPIISGSVPSLAAIKRRRLHTCLEDAVFCSGESSRLPFHKGQRRDKTLQLEGRSQAYMFMHGAGVVAVAKRHESATAIVPTGLGRITRGAAAAVSRSAEVIRAHVQRTLRGPA